MPKVLLLLIAWLVSACATTWHHPSKGRDEYKSDSIDCEVKAGQAGYAPATFGRESFWDTCMESKGWTAKRTILKQSE